MHSPIYLDHNATTPVDPEVIEEMNRVQAEGFANPASQHASGRRARAWLEDARERIAELLGARSGDRLLFTSGGTESNNLAIFGFAAASTGPMVTSSLEHPSVAVAAAELERQGRIWGKLPADANGQTELSGLEEICRERPALVALMLANNETGVLQPVEQAAAICSGQGIPSHVDAVQAVGKLTIDFVRLGPATLSIAAHKFGGPRGIGGLLVRRDIAIAPRLFGGAQQERLRPGTECTALAVGMCRALEIWERERMDRVQRLTQLRDRFEAALRAQHANLVVHGSQAPRLPNTSSISFPGLDRQALVIALDLVGIECSTGSACESGSSEPSATLVAMGLDNDLVQSAVRFSFGPSQTEAEIDEAVRRILSVTSPAHGGRRARAETLLKP